MDKKLTGILAYISFVGWIIAYLAGDKEGAKFHLNQALVLWLASVALFVIGIIPILGSLIRFVGGIVIFAFWVLGLVAAIKEEEKPLPLIGEIQILN